jgi:hypothetical protein
VGEVVETIVEVRMSRGEWRVLWGKFPRDSGVEPVYIWPVNIMEEYVVQGFRDLSLIDISWKSHKVVMG